MHVLTLTRTLWALARHLQGAQPGLCINQREWTCGRGARADRCSAHSARLSGATPEAGGCLQPQCGAVTVQAAAAAPLIFATVWVGQSAGSHRVLTCRWEASPASSSTRFAPSRLAARSSSPGGRGRLRAGCGARAVGAASTPVGAPESWEVWHPGLPGARHCAFYSGARAAGARLCGSPLCSLMPRIALHAQARISH